jgi:hypothetical protein
MELTLNRKERTDTTTIGELTDTNGYHCYTLEPKDIGLTKSMPEAEVFSKKITGKTAIPTGRYRIYIGFSEHFQKNVPMLVAVPGFWGVEIHPGNTAKDTKGCILLGYEKEENEVLKSRSAFYDLMLLLEKSESNGERSFITIQ